MKLLVLAAGYATRLYPLTRDRPKALLPVAGRPMVEHVLDRVGVIEAIDGVYLVTNAKFADQFQAWADGYKPARPGLAVTVVDDGTTSDETRLGAIGDIDLVLHREALAEDLIVVASDNLFTEDLGDFGAFSRDKDAAVVAVYDVGDLREMTKYNSIVVDEDGRVTFFEEKPERPTTTLTGIALYFYPRPVLPLVGRYLAEGNNPDQPGRLIEWLYTRTPVYAWPIPGRWYDIGSEESLREADRLLGATA